MFRNTKVITVMFFLSGMFCLSGSAFSDVQTGERAPAGSLNSGAIIPASEIENVKLAALHGSGEAARRLTYHYEFGIYVPEQAEYWTQIGAEDGDPVSEFSYGTLLLNKSDPMAKTRGDYWRDRAKRDGLSLVESKDSPAQSTRPRK